MFYSVFGQVSVENKFVFHLRMRARRAQAHSKQERVAPLLNLKIFLNASYKRGASQIPGGMDVIRLRFARVCDTLH